MTFDEAMEKIMQPDNWTDQFLLEVEPVYLQNYNTFRQTLTKAGLYSRFDTAFCERKKPGQVKINELSHLSHFCHTVTDGKNGISGIFGIFDILVKDNKKHLVSFPIDALIDEIGPYTKAAAESLQVPVDMIASLVLAVLSLCLQGKYNVLVKPDWVETINLYMVVIGRPSERKSPSMNEVFRPVYAYVDAENELRSGAVEEYELKKSILESKLNNIKSRMSKPKSPFTMQDATDCQKEIRELEEVNYLRIIVDDVTPEALIKVMKKNGERLALVSAEGGIFGMMAGRYTNNTNIDIFLKSYSGEHYSSDRAGKGEIDLKEPLLTVALAVQPQIIADIMDNKDFRGRGLLARFLYSMPDSKVGTRVYRSKPIDPAIRKQYEDLVNELLKLPDLGGFVDKTIKLSPEADKLSEEYNQWIEHRLTNEFEAIEDWAGKLHGNTMRIAGLFHVVRHKGNAVNVLLEEDIMQRAITIGKYYIEHSKAAFDAMGLSEPQEVKDAKYIISRIDHNTKNTNNTKNDELPFNYISKRDAWQLCKGHFGKVEEMDPGLKVLLEHGYIAILSDRAGKRGRPSEMIYINPEYYKSKGEAVEEPETEQKQQEDDDFFIGDDEWVQY